MGTGLRRLPRILATIESGRSITSEDEAWLQLHRMVPLVDVLGQRFPQILRRGLAEHVRATSRLDDLLTAFEESRIEVVAFKGLGFAYQPQVYGMAETRPLGDMDLWVRGGDLEGAVACAQSCGYKLVNPRLETLSYNLEQGYAVQLIHPLAGMLEIHHRLWRDIEDGLGQTMFQRAQPCAAKPWLKVLDAVDLAVVASVHAMQSGSVFWGWLVEIQKLIDGLDDRRVARLLDLVRGHGFQVCLIYAMGTAAVVTGKEKAGLPGWISELASELSTGEKLALHFALKRQSPATRLWLTAARRASRSRSARAKVSLARWLWPHPGAICMELNLNRKPRAVDRLRMAFQRMRKLFGFKAASRRF